MRSFIDVGIDSTNLVVIGNDGSVWRQNGSSWDRLPDVGNVGRSGRAPIAAAHHAADDSTVLLVRTKGMGGGTQLLRLVADEWASLGKPPRSIGGKHERQIVGLNAFGSTVAVCCNDGSIWQLTAGAWAEIPGPPRK